MRDIEKVLNNNQGKNSIVKFVKTLDGHWYFMGNGGLGTLIFTEVEEEHYPILNHKIENHQMHLLVEQYFLEIGKEGQVFYFQKD